MFKELDARTRSTRLIDYDEKISETKKDLGDIFNLPVQIRLWFNSLNMEQFRNSIDAGVESRAISLSELKYLRIQGKNLLTNKTKAFEKDIVLCHAMLKNWPKSDKILATIILVQNNPMYNLNYLDTLLGFLHEHTEKKGRAIIKVLNTLHYLFMSVLLPKRKLQLLAQQWEMLSVLPLSDGGDSILVYLYFEDCIKQRFIIYVDFLQQLTLNALNYVKENSLMSAYELLVYKSELEKILLTVIVEKLADPISKIASTTGYLMQCLLKEHPSMGHILVNEVENFYHRRNLTKKSQYHAIILINQIILTHNKYGQELACKLIGIYFTIFDIVVLTKTDVKKNSYHCTTNHHQSNIRNSSKDFKIINDDSIPEKNNTKLLQSNFSNILRHTKETNTDRCKNSISITRGNESCITFR